MSIPPAWPQVLDFFGTPLVIERSPGQSSGDAGLLPVGLSGRGIGFARAFDALDDPATPASRSGAFRRWSVPTSLAPRRLPGPGLPR
jgi:hypothetical protein